VFKQVIVNKEITAHNIPEVYKLNTVTGMLYDVMSLFTVTCWNTTGMLYDVISLYLL
jgi:hypothetical protein